MPYLGSLAAPAEISQTHISQRLPQLFSGLLSSSGSKSHSSSADEERDLHLQLLLAFFLALYVIGFWLIPLTSSFWIDEIATAFVIRFGPFHPSLDVAPQVTASIYYFLPRLADVLFGFSEIAYRLPSVLVMAIALLLISRLAARLIHPNATWFVAFACLTLHGINFQAADARPYALGTCVAAASLLFLVRWLDSADWHDALLFLIFAALLWRVHLTYWPLYIVFVLYALVRLVRGETRVGWFYASLVSILLIFALLPTLLEALALLREARAHVIVPVPSLGDFRNSLKLGIVAICGIAAWITSTGHATHSQIPQNAGGESHDSRSQLSNWFQRPPDAATPSWSSFTLILSWWLLHPLCLFLFSRLTGISVFLPRYLSVALPGAPLTATVAAGLFIRPAHWRKMSLLLAIGVLLNPAQWRDPWPQHGNSDWRAAANKINELAFGPDTPIICPSPFIEARSPAWQPDYRLPGFLYAHLVVYPIQGRPYPFPFESSREAEQFAMTLSRKTLSSSARFLIYGWGGNVRFWDDWFAKRPELAGWDRRSLGPFGNVEVVLFEKRPKTVLQPQSGPLTICPGKPLRLQE